MTVLMSGINMFSMAKVMQVVLGWDINFSIWVSSLTVALMCCLAACSRPSSMKCLQFFLIWLGALLIPILGLIEAGGWSGMVHRIHERCRARTTRTCGAGSARFSDNPMGIHWTGIVLGLGLVISFGYWTTDFLVVQRVLAAQGSARGENGAHHRRGVQDGRAAYRDSARLAGAGRAAR